MNDAYRFCRFCLGTGCLACPGEAKKAYDRDFPNGPQPLLTVKVNEEGKLAGPEAEVLKEVFSRDALTATFAGKSTTAAMHDLREALAVSKARHGVIEDGWERVVVQSEVVEGTERER